MYNVGFEDVDRNPDAAGVYARAGTSDLDNNRNNFKGFDKIGENMASDEADFKPDVMAILLSKLNSIDEENKMKSVAGALLSTLNTIEQKERLESAKQESESVSPGSIINISSDIDEDHEADSFEPTITSSRIKDEP